MATNFFRNKSLWIVILLIAAFVLPYLGRFLPDRTAPTTNNDQPDTPAKPAVTVNVPAFSPDSAYYFVEKQVSFGPRVPGTPAHKKCAAWLVGEFTRMGMTVIEQKFTAQTYFGPREAVNIIAQYKPELPNRVLLSAHWDSRHIGDKDSKDKDKPILGADDGASGVAVLLELARILQANPVDLGVDLICFDAEDLGDDRGQEAGQSIMTQGSNESKTLTWCLGSQYWSRNLHKPGYTAQFGILLDMVGAKGAVFPREGYSAQFAPRIQNSIWGIASELGYGSFFPNRDGGYVTDDHVFIIRGPQIPTVDIISIPNPPPKSFGSYHHTHNDNMDVIDRNTLGMVGHVVATVVYRTGAGVFL
ncbi:MAG: M28 family peptidase [Lewinellaceae bacterium]|nr:M28 family peptidase [Lewinellaceae bacterium]